MTSQSPSLSSTLSSWLFPTSWNTFSQGFLDASLFVFQPILYSPTPHHLPPHLSNNCCSLLDNGAASTWLFMPKKQSWCVLLSYSPHSIQQLVYLQKMSVPLHIPPLHCHLVSQSLHDRVPFGIHVTFPSSLHSSHLDPFFFFYDLTPFHLEASALVDSFCLEDPLALFRTGSPISVLAHDRNLFLTVLGGCKSQGNSRFSTQWDSTSWIADRHLLAVSSSHGLEGDHLSHMFSYKGTDSILEGSALMT